MRTTVCGCIAFKSFYFGIVLSVIILAFYSIISVFMGTRHICYYYHHKPCINVFIVFAVVLVGAHSLYGPVPPQVSSRSVQGLHYSSYGTQQHRLRWWVPHTHTHTKRRQCNHADSLTGSEVEARWHSWAVVTFQSWIHEPPSGGLMSFLWTLTFCSVTWQGHIQEGEDILHFGHTCTHSFSISFFSCSTSQIKQWGRKTISLFALNLIGHSIKSIVSY